MAPKLHKIFKRQAEGEEYEDEEPPTTLATKVFGKHLHKVKITTPTTTIESEGESHFTSLPLTFSRSSHFAFRAEKVFRVVFLEKKKKG